MKICFFADVANVHVQRLAPGLACLGHDVHVVCHKPTALTGVTAEKFRVPPAGLRNPHRWQSRFTAYLRGFIRRFDVVVIFFLHDWGFTPEMLTQGCVVASPRGSDIVPPPGELPPSAALVEWRIELLRNATSVGVGGPRFAKIVAAFADLDTNQIDSLPLGVDVDAFRPTPRAVGDHHRVGFFKGFREVYGASLLVEAIPAVLDAMPATRFDLCGNGPQLAFCRQLATRLGIDSFVEWLPRRPHSAMPGLLAEWDLTVMPSMCESFGVAALESSAMALPVIASDVGGLPDTVRHGETGVLVEPGSRDAVAQALIDLLKDAPQRRRMGAAGREWVIRNYTWRDVLRTWEATLDRARDRALAMV